MHKWDTFSAYKQQARKYECTVTKSVSDNDPLCTVNFNSEIQLAERDCTHKSDRWSTSFTAVSPAAKLEKPPYSENMTTSTWRIAVFENVLSFVGL